MKLYSLAYLQPALFRSLQTCSVLKLPVVVTVPPMGDSISEGSIAAIMKQNGADVSENEVIAQVETDKVTIDIRSPIDGKIENLLIKEDDVVVPGQTVAVVGEIAGSRVMSDSFKPEFSNDATVAAEPTPAPSTGPASAPAARYSPMIRFPSRMTADGTRISSLPANHPELHVQEIVSSPPVPEQQMAQSSTLNIAPLRKELTEEEMEAVMLGGAMP